VPEEHGSGNEDAPAMGAARQVVGEGLFLLGG
jgi:hypothetical protein